MDKKIIIWGAGNRGQFLVDLLRKYNIEIVAFGDSDLSKIGRTLSGIKVVSVNEITEKYSDVSILISIMANKEELNNIKKSIHDKGIKNYIYDYMDESFHKLLDENVENNRKVCADFHVKCMDKYFDDAETQEGMDIFWNKNSVFYKQFQKLNVENIVELACGRGRHVQMYLDSAKKVHLVDIVSQNIEYCKKRYQESKKIQYLITTGNNFKGIRDEECTAVFSYDAMVHFESIDIYNYLLDTARILKPGGMALFHHSNNYLDYKASFMTAVRGRNYMSMDLFAHYANRAGLEVLHQEVITWNENIDKTQNLPVVEDGLTLLIKPIEN